MRLFIALFALTTPIVAQHPGPVVISELMWSGSSASSADEWIELYNRSNATVDLSGWTLTRGSDDAIMLVLETGSIAAGGVFLIANYAADHEKSRVAAIHTM
ncbi:lamin tail domain-containing protein [bacterium]|nr:lamin tail domain-containing protein [bacterium]